MQQSMNDYPSIDKPWLKYYTKKDLGIQIPDMSLTEYIRTQNTNHLSLPEIPDAEAHRHGQIGTPKR